MTEILDKLTSGRRVERIVFVDGELVSGPGGMTVRFADDPEVADAWVCYDENGIWLNSNAGISDRRGFHGTHGCQDLLSAIKEVVLSSE